MTDVESLFRDFAPSLRRLGRSHGLATDQAEDLVQQTFVRVIAAHDRLDGSRPPAPYIQTIARNILRNERRDGETRRDLDGSVREHAVERRTEDPPDYAIATRRLVAHVLDLLRGLPASRREALVAVRIEGLSYREAAARFGKSEAAIRQDVSRAARALCDALGLELDAATTSGGPCPWCED